MIYSRIFVWNSKFLLRENIKFNIYQLSVHLIWSACVPTWVIVYCDAYATHWYAPHVFRRVRARLLHSRSHTWPAWCAGIVPSTIVIWDSTTVFVPEEYSRLTPQIRSNVYFKFDCKSCRSSSGPVHITCCFLIHYKIVEFKGAPLLLTWFNYRTCTIVLREGLCLASRVIWKHWEERFGTMPPRCHSQNQVQYNVQE